MDSPAAQYNSAVSIVKALRNGGFEAFFAGGWVRDFVMGGARGGDIDIATAATPDDIRRLFGRTVGVGEQFGVMVVLQDGAPFEVATFRADVGIKDGRHPESVAYTDARNDALRRDFTINGMFYDPLSEEVIDYVGGRQGIEERVIKAIGDPALRFAEDYLRMLRAVRFAARFGFAIDGETHSAIRAGAERITAISAERIFAEVNKMLTGPNPDRSLELLHDTGLLPHVLPEIDKLRGVEQPPQFHPEGDVFVHTVKTMSFLPPNPEPALAWAALLHDAGKPETMTVSDRIRFNNHHAAGARISESALKRLRAPNALIEAVTSMVENHMNFMNVAKMRLSTLKRFLSRDTIHNELELHKADCLSSHGELDNYHFIKEQLSNFKAEEIKPPPLITGKDLIALGFKPGPVFGRILGEIYDMQLEDKITTHEEAIKAAVDFAKEGGVAGGPCPPVKRERSDRPYLAFDFDLDFDFNPLILILTLILTLTSTTQSQNPNFYGPIGSTTYSIHDRHFHGVLFPEIYKYLPSTRIHYPGLWTPERNNINFALLPDYLSPNTAGLNGLYGFADLNLSPGSAGLWFGDFDYGEGYHVREYSDVIYSWETRELSLRGALWVTPFNTGGRLRGFSAAVDTDNAYAFNGDIHDGLTDLRHFCLTLRTLLRFGDTYSLRVALSINNRHAEDPADTRFDNRRRFTDALSFTLVDTKLRTFELRAENTFSMNYGDEKSDTVTVAARFTRGWALNYMDHTLFTGVIADASVRAPSNINDEAGSFQYMYYLQNMTADGLALQTGLSAPVVLDAGIARGVRVMLSVCPQAVYRRSAPPAEPLESPLYAAPQYRFYLYVPPAELSLRGTVGERVEYVVKPSFDGEVLVSAVEVRYRF